MKRVVKNTAFAVLLVLTLCTIAAYHIEQLMMAMRDGNTGVYIIDYVEGAFGEEMVARFVPVTVEAQDQQNFSSGDLFDFREYVVSSNRSLKDGEEVAAP